MLLSILVAPMNSNRFLTTTIMIIIVAILVFRMGINVIAILILNTITGVVTVLCYC